MDGTIERGALALDAARQRRSPPVGDLAQDRIQVNSIASPEHVLVAGVQEPRLRAVSLSDFLALDIPPPEPLLGSLLTRQSLAMVYAWRGVGKTWFALYAAYAVASGGTFLRWKADQPHRVLYLDGEMPAASMQKRLATIAAAAENQPPEGFFQLVTPDLSGGLVPDLATHQGQAAVDALIATAGAELIVLDNLSCWVRSGGAENEAESWRLMSEWLLRHRSAGRTVLLVHHSGKNLAQRGTSKKEDILDVSIDLRRPPQYEPEQGAAFTIEFVKAAHDRQPGRAVRGLPYNR